MDTTDIMFPTATMDTATDMLTMDIMSAMVTMAIMDIISLTVTMDTAMDMVTVIHHTDMDITPMFINVKPKHLVDTTAMDMVITDIMSATDTMVIMDTMATTGTMAIMDTMDMDTMDMLMLTIHMEAIHMSTLADTIKCSLMIKTINLIHKSLTLRENRIII